MSPTVSVVPIKIARYRKVLVLTVWVRNVAHKSIHVINIGLCEPAWIEVTNNGSSQDKVAIVEVMVVVVRVTKIRTVIAGLVGGRGHYPSPSGYSGQLTKSIS